MYWESQNEVGEQTWNPPSGPVPTHIVDQSDTRVAGPRDPNEKVGPPGIGARRLVSVDDDLQYIIYFENVITATAPAQEVFVTDDLDPDLDWSTFRLTEVAFGDQLVPIIQDTGTYTGRETVLDYRAGNNTSWLVDIATAIDPQNGRASWTLRTLDPLTGDLPQDPLAGFLPPNDATGRGEGHVAFTIKPRPDLADGALLANNASIVFDTNAPIVTNLVTNTIGTIVSPTQVSLAGPATGLNGAPYTFTATVSPISATLPISYVWETTGQEAMTRTGGLSDTVSFTWSTPGMQVITVTATNFVGAVSDTHLIAIDSPLLSISKAGPAEGNSNELITYTLTVTNDGVGVVNDLVITDAVPAGANFVWASAGGQLVDNQVVSWTVASLASYSSLTCTFSVTATQTITNSDYRVTALGGIAAAGGVAVETIIRDKVYLPVVIK